MAPLCPPQDEMTFSLSAQNLKSKGR